MPARERITRLFPQCTRPQAREEQSGEAELEIRLNIELRRYARDVPEDAFPTFLESLYHEAATSGKTRS